MSCLFQGHDGYGNAFHYWFPWDDPEQVLEALEDCHHKMVTRYSNGTISVTYFDKYRSFSLRACEEVPEAVTAGTWCLEVYVDDKAARIGIRRIGTYDEDGYITRIHSTNEVIRVYEDRLFS